MKNYYIRKIKNKRSNPKGKTKNNINHIYSDKNGKRKFLKRQSNHI